MGLEDESATAAHRMMRCVEGEGLPLLRDPYQFGNLFLDLDIEMPHEISPSAEAKLRAVLPPPLNSSTADESAESVDTHVVRYLDPVASYKEGIFSGKDSY